jgi:formate-dependent nitrite reductase complex subunit NrfG
MNSLVIAIVVILLSFIAPLWSLHLCTVSVDDTSAATSLQSSAKSMWLIPTVMTMTLLLVTLIVYVQIGRFADWDKGQIDENIDYLIAADINKNAKAVSETPYDKLALLKLAHAYAEGGLYAQSVETLDKLLAIEPDAEVLGMKANAIYYRDGRDMSLAVSITLSQALALDPDELQSLLLMATHAYLNKDFQQAIVYWQQLLDSNNPNVNRASINRAILKAEQSQANRTVTASE